LKIDRQFAMPANIRSRFQLGGSSQRKETEYEAKEVIMTGWKRSRAPSVAASSSGMPCSLSVLELDDQDAVLRHQPDGGALGRI
jgi:hypothetical protein